MAETSETYPPLQNLAHTSLIHPARRPAGDSGGSGPGVRKSHPHGYTLGPVDLRAMDRPPDATHKTGRPEAVFRLTL